MNVVIGIDPGLTGAIASFTGGVCTDIFDMPTTVASVKRKRNKKGEMQDYPQYEVDGEALYTNLANLLLDKPEASIYIEQVGAVYRQDKQGGVAAFQPLHATFVFGEGAGVVRGISEALVGREGVHKVAPITWKKHFGLIGTVKDAARLLILDQQDDFAKGMMKRKKDSGRADAYLIGQYGNSQEII